MKKTFTLVTLMILCIVSFAQNDAFLYKDKAMSSFLSKDYSSANQYFAKLHTAEENYMDFEDLLTYYLSAEKANDSILCKNLLFEIVQHNYFERYKLNDSIITGFDIKSDSMFLGFIHDTLVAESEILLEEYMMQLDQNGNAFFDSTCSFDDAKKLIDTQDYPRYSIDAWNNVLPSLIKKESANIGIDDYQHFFGWLYDQVIVGNFHLFDYAELYDEVYNRLFGKSYYGEKLFADGLHVRRSEVKKISERRRAVNLPPFWVSCGLKGVNCPKGYKKEMDKDYYRE